MIGSTLIRLKSLGVEIISNDDNSIVTRHKFSGVSYEVKGLLGPKFPLGLPVFYLKERGKYGLLAHVGWPDSEDTGLICSGADDALSLNYHAPEKVYEEALNMARKTIESVLVDSVLNEKQCLEEFYGHWKWASGFKGDQLLVVAPAEMSIVDMAVRGPSKKSEGLSAKLIASPSDWAGLPHGYCVVSEASGPGRKLCGKAILLQLTHICLPPAPHEDITDWLRILISTQPDDLRNALKQKGNQIKAKNFWFICQVEYDGQIICFALRCEAKKKARVPIHPDYFSGWKISPIEVDLHSRRRLLPRGGASIDLQDKNVILVGCGSVGSHIADQLVSAGIGRFQFIDFDSFQPENLYRHSLSMKSVDINKAEAIAARVIAEYPYTKATASNKRLLDLTKEELDSADLIVVAIGSPTSERAFNEMLISKGVNVPVVYCWLEGYGVGGHAVFVSGDHKTGCLECSYIDPTTLETLLHSNMNFLKANEPVTKDIGGCGTLFLPYSQLDAQQTALIASRLSLDALLNDQAVSKKSSWVGAKEEAKKAGIAFVKDVTEGAGTTEASQLKQQWCPCCYKAEVSATYSGRGKVIQVLKPVKDIWDKYRQLKACDTEACGILIGSVDVDGSRIWIEAATEPMPNDIRKRSRFYMKDKGHQETLNRLHKTSGGRLVFLGTWHSHPEANPSFSDPDKTGWKKCINANPPLSSFYFSIIGTESDSVFVPKKSGFEMMKKMRCL